MDDRLLSGHAPLDEILGGGLPANAISLIMGRPGSGKTILAQQYAFRNGQPGRPVIYFSTVSELLEKIVRFGQSLTFFDTAAIGTSVFYEDLGATVHQDGLSGVTEQLGRIVRERRPGLIVIGSFKALQAFARDYGEFRKFLHELAGRPGAFPAASLWVASASTLIAGPPTIRTFVIGSQGIVLDELPPATQDSHPNDSGPASVPTP